MSTDDIRLTAEELLTTLILERDAGDRRLAIVVEGAEDCALIDIHLDEAVARSTWSGSKSAVLEAAAAARVEGLTWIHFVVDKDLDSHLGLLTAGPNVVSTDNYDLLMDALAIAPYLVAGAALSHGDPEWLRSAFAGGIGGSVLYDRILEVCTIAGAARLLSRKHSLGVKLAGLNFRTLPHGGGLESAIEWLKVELTPRGESNWTAIEPALGTIVTVDRSLCRGHDVTGALAALMYPPGTSRGSRNAIAASLRLAVGCQNFMRLTVARVLCRWSVEVSGRSVFRCNSVGVVA